MFTSCALPKYSIHYETNHTLDFRSGKWLVNTVESDFSRREDLVLTQKVYETLNKLAPDSVFLLDEIRGKYIMQPTLPFEITEETLSDLCITTPFDYIINVKGEQLASELSTILLYAPDKGKRSAARLEIVVYDVKAKQLLYCQKIIGELTLNESNEDVKIASSSSSLLNGSLKRGLKEIKKHAITTQTYK